MPSAKTTKWVFCHHFHVFFCCSKYKPIMILFTRSKSRSKIPIKRSESEILTPEEVSLQVTPTPWVFFSFSWFTLSAKQNLPQCIFCQGWGQAPCACHQRQWHVRVCLTSIFSTYLLIYFFSEILETPTRHKKTKLAKQPSPGSSEFEDLPPVTISYVLLPFFSFINNFHDVAVVKLGR